LANTSFYIAQRYLISKKGNTAVTFITWLAAFAMMAAVASMFIIISVFAGLEDLNKDMISNLHADLTLTSTKGKSIKDLHKVETTLKKNPSVVHFSKIIEEKAYVTYKNVGEIAYLRGVDSAYSYVNPIQKKIYFGKYPSFTYSNEVILEHGLANRLSIPVDVENDYAWLFMPKAGSGIISKEEDIFNKKPIYVTGIFMDTEQMNNFVIAPIELTQELLNLPKNTAYQIVMKLKNPSDADAVKAQLLKNLGKEYSIKTKNEENAAFWKMINTEKLMIYLIFSLVVFITTFNLAGAITILQLDKKEQSKSLLSLGFSLRNLRFTYFYTGCLIVVFGLISGLLLGSAICYIQISTGLFKASEFLPFPIRISLENYFIVSAIALLFGLSISWIFSKINKNLLINKN